MSELKVEPQSRVLVELDLRLADGSLAESTRNSGKPALLNLGDGSLSPAFEAQLVGLGQGSQCKFTLSAEQAYGAPIPDLIQYFSRQAFIEAGEPEIGTIMLFGAMDGGEMPGIIRELSGESVTVDFNHPLAGHDITFDIEVLEINPALEKTNEDPTG